MSGPAGEFAFALQIEQAKLLSTAENLGLLAILERLLVTDPGKVTALSIPFFILTSGGPFAHSHIMAFPGECRCATCHECTKLVACHPHKSTATLTYLQQEIGLTAALQAFLWRFPMILHPFRPSSTFSWP